MWVYYLSFVFYRTFEPNGLLEDPVILQIAKRKGKSSAQILLRFVAQLGVAVIPKSISPNRIKENFQVLK